MARRITGIIMLGLEAVVLWRTMGYLPIALLAMTVALVGCWPRLRLDWGYRKKYFSSGAIALAYLIWWWLDLQYLDPSRSSQFENSLGLAGALGTMMIQAQQYFWRDERGLPNYFPFLGALAMAFATDHYLTSDTERDIVFGLTMTFGIVAVVFFALDHRPSPRKTYGGYRYTLIGVCALLSLGLAAGTAWVIGESEQAVGRMLTANMAKKQLVLGNRSTAQLDSMSDIKGQNFDHIALEIMADASPGYLRGQVYGRYQNRSWSAIPMDSAPMAVETAPPGFVAKWSSEKLYPIDPDATTILNTMVVYPDPAIERALFTPLEAGWIGRPQGGIRLSDAQVAETSQKNHGFPYHVITTPRPPIVPLDTESRALYTELPEDLAPRILSLASSVCGTQSTTLGKANAVTQYFTSNYEYTLGIVVPRGADPMEYFLFSDPLPDAHCEYFATGAAFLLRASGVPTRYVTGVGVWEQHPFADYWVARNRDSHAWVEAWDDELGWFIVEATPASGLPEAGASEKVGGLRDFWQMIALKIKRAIAAIREGAWTTLLSAIREILVTLIHGMRAAWWILLLILGAGVALWQGYRRWKFRTRRDSTNHDIHLRAMQYQLSTMDRWVGKTHRLKRAAHVTPHAFAREIEAATSAANPLAHWYRNWAEVRYRNSADEAAVARLERELTSAQRNAKHD